MPWPGREINYQEEFGVASKEELKAKLEKINTLETTNATLNTTIEAQAGEVNTVKATLAALEGKIATMQPVNANTNNNNNTNNGNVEIPSVTEDEDAAFATRMAPLYAATLTTNAKLNKAEVVGRMKVNDPHFPKLEKEFNEILKTISLRDAGHENGAVIIENAYHVVRSRHMDQILQDQKAGKGEFFIESASNSGNSGNGSVKTDPNNLTPDEEVIVARMGISKEAYLKSRNSNVNMSGALRYA